MSVTLLPVDVPSGERHPHRWGALVVLCAAALIINLDNTILNVALPTLVRDLHATSSQLQWIVDSYAMVFAGLLLVGGSLADRLGRKQFFLIGLAVFAAGSIGAAASDSVQLLIGFRAVMGAGAALTIPSSLSIVNDVFRDPKERARGHRRLGRNHRSRHRHRTDCRRLVTGPVLVGLHLFGERPDRHSGVRGGGPFGTGLEESDGGPAGPGRRQSSRSSG